jgi:hypothetical protein
LLSKIVFHQFYISDTQKEPVPVLMLPVQAVFIREYYSKNL